MEANAEVIGGSQAVMDSSRMYVGGRKPLENINADNVALFQKPWTNLDQRKKEVATLNSLHMVNDRRNGWLEAIAKSVDNSFASTTASLSTPDHGHIVQGRLRGWKTTISGVEEDALNDFQFHSATPGGHPKPVGEWESPAERQWSLSASGADTAEASNSPPCTAKGGMSEAFSRDASPPCEEMMTPPRCEMIAGLAANTPRYTPRYTPRVAVQHRLPPGEVSVLDGLDEARESSPFGECEGYFSRLQVHDSSLAMTPSSVAVAVTDDYSSPLRPAGRGMLLGRSSPPPDVSVSAVVENAWQVVNASDSAPDPSKMPVSPLALEVRMYNSPGVVARKDELRARLGGSDYAASPSPSPGAAGELDDTSIHSEPGEGYYYIPEDDPMGADCTWMPSPPPPVAPNSWWGEQRPQERSAGGDGLPPTAGEGICAVIPPGEAKAVVAQKFDALTSTRAEAGTVAVRGAWPARGGSHPGVEVVSAPICMTFPHARAEAATLEMHRAWPVHALAPHGEVMVDAATYTPPPAARADQKTPAMCGVGVKLVKHGPSGAIVIADIARNGPADKTGLISVGDQLVKINNDPIGGMDVRRAQDMLRGLPGTTVMISMWHTASARERADEGILINAVVVREQFVYSEQALA